MLPVSSLLIALCLPMLANAASIREYDVEGKERPCDGGIAHNATTERGAFWYQCKDRFLVPKGCVTREGDRVEIGESFVSQNILITCAISDDGSYPMFQNTACVFDNTTVKPDTFYENERAWVSCDHNRQLLSLTIHGCMLDGVRHQLGERARYNDAQILDCQRHRTAGAMWQALGCIFQGQDYRIGEKFQDNMFMYSCELEDPEMPERSVRRPVACLHDGTLHYDLQRWTVGDQIYKCSIGPGINASHDVAGCLVNMHKANQEARIIDKFLGCYWIEEEAKFQNAGYLMHCKLGSEGKSVVEREHCLYNTTDGYQLEMASGCYRPVRGTKTVIGCMPTEVKLIETVVLDKTEIASEPYNKLKLC